LRQNKQAVPQLADRLLDSEPAVALAAHAALISLLGEDRGPSLNATEEEKRQAVARWQDKGK
jgi:hypothetical protein